MLYFTNTLINSNRIWLNDNKTLAFIEKSLCLDYCLKEEFDLLNFTFPTMW